MNIKHEKLWLKKISSRKYNYETFLGWKHRKPIASFSFSGLGE